MTRDPLPDGTGVAVADPPSTTLSRHRTGVPLRPNRTGVPLRPNRTGVPLRPNRTVVTLRPNRTVVTLRRNRTVAALSGLTATTAVFGSLPALGALEFVAATFGLLLAGYLAMTARLRALAAARDMSTAFGGAAGDLAWDDFVRQLSGSLAAPDAPSVRGATPRDRAGAPAARRVTAGEPAPGDATGEGGTIGGLDLLRFAGLYALGWALTPAAALLRWAGRSRSGLDRARVARLVLDLQERGRSQSLRLLAAGAAAGASMAVTTGAVAATGAAALDADTPAAAPATASAPSPVAAAGSPYVVRPGDTLWLLAARFGTTVQALAAANGIADPDLIYAGQTLRVVGPTAGTAAGAAPSAPVSAPPPPPPPAPPAAAAPPSAPPAPPAAGSAQQVAVQVALQQVGKPYQWGGAGPAAFDCSGLVTYAYAAAGVALPHYTVSQYTDTVRVAASELAPGDIVFYQTSSGAQPGHEALYLGGGQVVAANSPGTRVQVQPITYDGPVIGYGRVP